MQRLGHGSSPSIVTLFLKRSIEIVRPKIIDCEVENANVRTSHPPGRDPASGTRKSKPGGYVSITRRTFLKAGTASALVALIPKWALGLSGKFRDANSADAGTLANYSKATFESYLNSIFQLQTVNGTVAVTLVNVADMPAPKGGECFTLLFRGGKRSNPQDTYTLVHPSLGTFQLLLVPAGCDQKGARGYLATVNRLSLVDAINNQLTIR